jgi:hypothetical protein
MNPDGKIYRIPDSITVPGLTRDSSGNVVPGTIDVEVIADEPGEDFNTGKVDFTIPGFKDLPQFDGFYAKAVTDISGGFEGVRKVISEEDRESAEAELRETLQQKLTQSAQDQSTDEFSVFVDENLFDFQLLPEKPDGDNVVLKMRGTGQAVAIKSKDLASALAQASLTSFNTTDSILIENKDSLSISVTNITEGQGGITASVEVTGNADFIWQTDHNALKKALAGNNRKDLRDVLQDFTSVSRAEAEISPFWKNKFPKNLDKIEIIEKEAKN